MKILTCTIPVKPISYDIVIQNGILNDMKKFMKLVAEYRRFAIIADDNISQGELLRYNLKKEGLEAYLFTFPSGEQQKSRMTKETLENQMFERSLGKDTCIIAVGGGVVTDLGGYLAATYCRGVPLILIPTSLLGMVDACIGGKTAINVPYGKNLLGCLYQPKKVIVDSSTLKTLPHNEIKNGVVEMIKHGLIADKKYFGFLEKNAIQILKKDLHVLDKAIIESCRIKKEIIEQDPYDNGKRVLLNFGHTVGHAIEKLSNYAIPHGIAVAIGILTETHMAMQIGLLSSAVHEKIYHLFKLFEISLKMPKKYPEQDLYKAMMLDKKSIEGSPRFVMIRSIGEPETYDNSFCTHLDETVVINGLKWMNDALCSH